MTNRQQRRAQQKQLIKDNSKLPNVFVEIPEKDWPFEQKNMIKVFRSKNFLVQIYKEADSTRLSICRPTVKNDGHWESNISWEELQDIKNQLGYGNDLAVEIYPNDKNVVNVANMRHLWIMDHDLNIGWKK